LKTRKGKARLPSLTEQTSPNATYLTRQGYAELESEIAALKGKRSQAIEEMRKAAADKDFRENAPLEAAREQRGHLEGRIKELEETLKCAVVIEDKQNVTARAGLGASVVLCDLTSGDEVTYTIVSPTEVDPAKGRISSVSPIGKVVVGKAENDIVEVTVPAGKLRYQIKQIKH
jgi:transcription elongation factor GreA